MLAEAVASAAVEITRTRAGVEGRDYESAAENADKAEPSLVGSQREPSGLAP